MNIKMTIRTRLKPSQIPEDVSREKEHKSPHGERYMTRSMRNKRYVTCHNNMTEMSQTY